MVDSPKHDGGFSVRGAFVCFLICNGNMDHLPLKVTQEENYLISFGEYFILREFIAIIGHKVAGICNTQINAALY